MRCRLNAGLGEGHLQRKNSKELLCPRLFSDRNWIWMGRLKRILRIVFSFRCSLGWCSNCSQLVLSCSNCAQLVLKLCSAGAQIVLSWCSIVLSWCLYCVLIVLSWCSIVLSWQIVLSWWRKLCSAGAKIVLSWSSNINVYIYIYVFYRCDNTIQYNIT